MDELSSRLMALWAKTDRTAGGGAYHPLLCHLIDVAAVARAMWHHVLPPALTGRLAGGLGLRADDAETWVAFLAGLHDLGKASPGFQAKDPTARARVGAAGLTWLDDPVDRGHGVVTTIALRGILANAFAVPRPAAVTLAATIGGHHGVLPAGPEQQGADVTASRGDQTWDEARRALVSRLAEALGVPRDCPPQRVDHPTALVLAGLVSVADWIGSDERFFPYAGDPASPTALDVDAYAAEAARRALAALRTLGWLDWSPSPARLDLRDLFPYIEDPRPVQVDVATLPGIPEHPGIVVLELPMGEGKTEAALYLADRWGTALGQRGCYVAMPTMATSNQMFARVHDFLQRRYPDCRLNLQLLHSQAAIAPELEATRAAGDTSDLRPVEIYGEPCRDGTRPEVAAGEWFTRRKRGLLAPFGVGTVDQTLLAALRTRHVFVRTFGLAGKTVIFDEVHAYDVYMSTLFERLIEWLAAIGSSVVVLSATLPRQRRDALLAAYARGAGVTPDDAVPHAPYPRISWLTAAGQGGAKAVEISRLARRALQLEWVDGRVAEDVSVFTLGARLQAALASGGCAVVICNTIRRAQTVYQALKEYFPGVADDGDPVLDLLHARFPFVERDRREKRALRRFGKPGGTVADEGGTEIPVRRPRRAVLVATQIVEQSLDLDFDLMVSDLAPVDLLLQRSGRLHRHDRLEPRPHGLEQPRLWICRPEISADGVPAFGSERFIYHPHVLLRSWLALGAGEPARETIQLPEDVEPLINAVYDPGRPCPPEASEPLRAYWDRTRRDLDEKLAGDAFQAKSRRLGSPWDAGPIWDLTRDAREEDAPEIHEAHQALTRLGGPSVSIVCLAGSEDHPALDPEGKEVIRLSETPSLTLARRLLGRAVPVANHPVVDPLVEQPPPSGWRRSALLCHHRAVVFGPDGSARVGDWRLRLDAELGLLIERGEEAL